MFQHVLLLMFMLIYKVFGCTVKVFTDMTFTYNPRSEAVLELEDVRFIFIDSKLLLVPSVMFMNDSL